jgi:uncharacterized protein DUF1360
MRARAVHEIGSRGYPRGVTDAVQEAKATARAAVAPDGYAPESERPPLVSYTVIALLFNIVVAAALGLARRQGREIPRPGAGDIALLGVSAHKLSRLVSKDKVTSPLRAPFTELEGSGGPAEFEEKSRGTGVRKAIGELLICPYCLGLWVVTGFALGLIYAPRLTRFVMAIFSALTIADFLQVAYRAGEEKGLG